VVKKDAAIEPKGKAANASATAEDGFSVVTFLQGTKEELGKVVWPSRQQLISESAAVILMVSLSATLIYLVDRLFGWLSGQVF
jgi:preprotein translocase subunit SecE